MMTLPWLSAANVILAVAIAALLLSSLVRTRGTTLVAPCVWALVACLALVVSESIIAGWNPSPAARAVLRYLAALTTFCPAMALLGAKRPQDRGWQFIVGSLWIVLALPALQPILLARSSLFDLHPAWSAFLGVLILISVCNYLPTRFALPAVLSTLR